MLAQMLQGDAWLASAAVIVIGLTWLAEVALTTRRWPPLFRLGFPLGAELVPLPTVPTGQGGVDGLLWAVEADGGGAIFWTEGGAALPRGLRGRVAFAVDRHGRVHLQVVWAPWSTPLLAFAWLACVGALRGEGWVTVPLSLMLTWTLLWVYWGAARGAAESLRWAFVVGGADDAGPGHSQGGRPA